ncbi:MAG TPA: CHRD domain-containing protein [Beijerinckiaceae bacterium]|nr:CHRD domain-containing protein [Beijerinckiaceae bacterium]
MKHAFGSALAVTLLIVAPSLARAATAEFHASLSGKAEVPPNASAGKGMAKIGYDSSTKKLTWTVTYSGLSGPAIGAHFHGPAGPGTSAPVEVPVKGSLANPIKGSAVITDPQAKDLMDGKLYFNIHTKAHKAGEIRGQVEKGPAQKDG